MKNISKKHIVIGVASIVLLCGLYLSYSMYSENKFIKNAQQLKENMAILTGVSSNVTSEYYKIWSRAIKNNWVYIDGKDQYFSGFEDALKYVINKNSDKGVYDVIDSLMRSSSKLMKEITPYPGKYKDLYNDLKSMYSDTNEYAELAKSPSGSLVSFGNKTGELESSIVSKIKSSEIILEKTENIGIKSLTLLVGKELSIGLAKQREIEGLWAENKAIGEEFLADNKEKNGVTVTNSGLQYKIIKTGNGKIPKENDKVKVHYKGELIDGTEFDSSYKRNEPTSFRANQVIEGWKEALTMMPVGSKWIIYIPQELAYGKEEQGEIKPYSTLIFEVELFGISE